MFWMAPAEACEGLHVGVCIAWSRMLLVGTQEHQCAADMQCPHQKGPVYQKAMLFVTTTTICFLPVRQGQHTTLPLLLLLALGPCYFDPLAVAGTGLVALTHCP
jgi:hypothetical protein